MAFEVVCSCGAKSIIEKTTDGYNWSVVKGDISITKDDDDITMECKLCKQTTGF